MKKTNKVKEKKPFGKFYLFLMIVLISFLSAFIFYQYGRLAKYEENYSILLREIEVAETLFDDLSLKKEDQYNDEHIEKIAREQLGMIKANEILFIDQNK